MTLDYHFTPRLNLGVEYNIAADELNPRGNYQLFNEGKYNPTVSLGTSSDRIGSPKGTQAYFVTFGKTIPKTFVAPYFSVNYSSWDKELNFPFGANFQLHPRFGIMPMYDGQRSHLLANYSANGWTLTAIWAWLERVGVASSVGF